MTLRIATIDRYIMREVIAPFAVSVGLLTFALVTGKLLKLANTGTGPVTLSEDQVAPPNAVAISLAKPKLEAGQETTAFVVVRAARSGDQP